MVHYEMNHLYGHIVVYYGVKYLYGHVSMVIFGLLWGKLSLLSYIYGLTIANVSWNIPVVIHLW